jgi:hypothetical protein
VRAAVDEGAGGAELRGERLKIDPAHEKPTLGER